MEIPLRVSVDVLHVVDALVAAHIGTRLKALRFFLTAGLDLEGAERDRGPLVPSS